MTYENKQYRCILPKTANIEITVENSAEDVVEQDATITTKTIQKRRLYKCCECDEVFVRFANLVKHELQHYLEQQNKDAHICELCLSLYQSAEELHKHATLIHTNDRHLCLICQKNYKSRRYLLRHVQEVHKQLQLIFYCMICAEKQEFRTRSMLMDHFHMEHTNNKNEKQKTIEPISTDDYEFEMTEEFLDEFLLNNDDVSSFGFTEWETLGDLKLTDMLLNESTSSVNDSTTTTTTTTTIKYTNYNCPQNDCTYNCQEIKELLMHLVEEHKINININNSFQCPYCNRQHKRISYLRQHLRVRHAIWKKHICQICDKQFASMDHLRKHVLSIHHNERRHTCNNCQKSFTQLSHLKQHMAKTKCNKNNIKNNLALKNHRYQSCPNPSLS